jgi:hypothetical protein
MEFMNRFLVVGLMNVWTAPLFAQAQPDIAKLKADSLAVRLPARLAPTCPPVREKSLENLPRKSEDRSSM